MISERRPWKIVEIGRWLGGSTILLCAASSQYGGQVISVDLKVKAPEYAKDVLIENHLKSLALKNYKLFIASSFDFNPGNTIDLAFIDGDHSYEGVKKDFVNVMRYLSAGGDIIFHDSCSTRPFATKHEGVALLVKEIKHDKKFIFTLAECVNGN